MRKRPRSDQEIIGGGGQELPFMHGEPATPYAGFSRTNTDACCNIYCECGADHHFDGYFLHFVKCPSCGAVYEVDHYMALRRVEDEPEGTILLKPEPEAADAELPWGFGRD